MNQLPIEICDPSYAPFWSPDLSHESYHADKTAVGSSSLRRMLVSGVNFSYWFMNSKPPTPSMKFGTMAHLAILEGQKFLDRYVVMPEFWGYTKKGEKTNNANCTEVKEEKDAWMQAQSPDAIIVTEEERTSFLMMMDRVIGHNDAFAFSRTE